MIDDYDWRTQQCRSVIFSKYRVGTEAVEASRKCSGSIQYRRKGTSEWKCHLCNRVQYGGPSDEGKKAPTRGARTRA
jgi:uncharacterized protein YaiE (UPF0345 family)